MKYNKSGLVVLLVSTGFSLVWFVGLIVFAPSMEIAQLEGTAGIPTGLKGAKQVDISEVQNPWVFSDLMVERGVQVYQVYCASCHGPKGLGDGVAGATLNPPPRNLIEGGWKYGGTSLSLYKTLAQGIEGSSMVSFSYLPKKDRWALVHYVRSISQDKPEDNKEELEAFAREAK